MLFFAIARFALVEFESLDAAITLIYGAQSASFALMAWTYSRYRIEADADGLHLIRALRTATYRWEDIAEIRPSIAKGKRTFLVLVRRNRQIIDLPITEEHLDELRRWHQTAA